LFPSHCAQLPLLSSPSTEMHIKSPRSILPIWKDRNRKRIENNGPHRATRHGSQCGIRLGRRSLPNLDRIVHTTGLFDVGASLLFMDSSHEFERVRRSPCPASLIRVHAPERSFNKHVLCRRTARSGPGTLRPQGLPRASVSAPGSYTVVTSGSMRQTDASAQLLRKYR
jgi:hypothetical protein